MQAFEEKINYSAESRIMALHRQSAAFRFAWHYHDAFELTYISKGWGQRFVRDKITTYEKGDFVLLPPGLPHTWQSEKASLDNQAYIIQFNNDCLGKNTFSGEDFRELKAILDFKGGYVFNGHVGLKRKFEKVLNNFGVLRVAYFLELLHELLLLDKVVLCSGNFTRLNDKEQNCRMDKIMDYLENLKGLPPDVTALADDLGMSESTFRRFIKRNTGKSIVNFYNELCINKACKLLIETDNSVSDISLSSGYRNLSHFNRVFKTFKDMTPGGFRKKFMKKS